MADEEQRAVDDAPLVLRYSHHVIEHLGLKLYQNRPTNVVAELVSNGWDANARSVWIDLQTATGTGDPRFLGVVDDGLGMTRDDLKKSYLVIGKPKDRSDARKKERYPMGRKGIGKLAPFGIARKVDVVTASEDSGSIKYNWLRIDLESILRIGSETDPDTQAVYPPDDIVADGTSDDIRECDDPTGQVGRFLDRIQEGTGTLILMSELSLIRSISEDALRESMGRRFTVTLNREDFTVYVNEVAVTAEDALPEFEHRFPPSGFHEELVAGRTIRHWVGFVETASWPADEAGIGVYAHGKIGNYILDFTTGSGRLAA